MFFVGACMPRVERPGAFCWKSRSEATDYFPVHDGMLKIIGPFHGVPQAVLKEAGITFTTLELGIPVGFN